MAATPQAHFTARPAPSGLAARFRRVRARTEALVEGLSAEDLGAQSMPDASPGKWHLAHTTWFFESFVLGPSGAAPLQPEWMPLFNSYYEALGARHPRCERGLLTRPALEEVLAWRHAVDARMEALLEEAHPDGALAQAVELGLQHEQQHQELLVTDLKHLLHANPLAPAWRPRVPRECGPGLPDLAFHEHAEEGRTTIGAPADGFAFDHERPRHTVWLRPFALASRPVTNGEYLAFVEAGGYRDASSWLSDGWAAVQSARWDAPLYWRHRGHEGWDQFTVRGYEPLDPAEPVCHVSYYEADAFARWAGMRLPTEAEWEHVAATRALRGEFADGDLLHPQPVGRESFGGNVWEWTASAYLPYPGFVPLEGAAGEYNGKFMSSQMVLRGGSCATPREHIRASYRNFFPPHARWQFSGIRLARDLA